MKQIILTGIILGAMIGVAGAQTRTLYDNRGSAIGSATTNGNRTTFRDYSGRPQGYAVQRPSGQTRFYDQTWRPTGSSSWGQP